MKSIKVCEYSRLRSFHYDLILQDQASGERSQDQWSSGSSGWDFKFIIRITCLCYVYLLIPHFYVAKLGYTRVYLFFLFLLQNLDCGYSLEPSHLGGSSLYPKSIWAK